MIYNIVADVYFKDLDMYTTIFLVVKGANLYQAKL